jgi:hypothetical protein
VTRISAAFKWINSTLTASCAAAVRDGPELSFFTAAVAAAESPAYECATRMSVYAALFTAVSHATAFSGLISACAPRVLKYMRLARSKHIKSKKRFYAPPPAMLMRVGLGIIAASLFAYVLNMRMVTNFSGDFGSAVSQCSCSFGVCAPGSESVCTTCISGYELNRDEGRCVPLSCACENGACSQGQLSRCSTCGEAFHLTPDGTCALSACDCPNGFCSATNSYCTSCHPDFVLRSTGLPARSNGHGGYIFSTPICIHKSVLHVAPGADGVCIFRILNHGF